MLFKIALSLQKYHSFSQISQNRMPSICGDSFRKLWTISIQNPVVLKPPLPVPKACSQSHIHLRTDTAGFNCLKQINNKDWKGLSVTVEKVPRALFFFPQRVRNTNVRGGCVQASTPRPTGSAPQQPLPFCRQISQKTWPQLVMLNRGLGLRGSLRHELQNTGTAMG